MSDPTRYDPLSDDQFRNRISAALHELDQPAVAAEVRVQGRHGRRDGLLGDVHVGRNDGHPGERDVDAHVTAIVGALRML